MIALTRNVMLAMIWCQNLLGKSQTFSHNRQQIDAVAQRLPMMSANSTI